MNEVLQNLDCHVLLRRSCGSLPTTNPPYQYFKILVTFIVDVRINFREAWKIYSNAWVFHKLIGPKCTKVNWSKMHLNQNSAMPVRHGIQISRCTILFCRCPESTLRGRLCSLLIFRQLCIYEQFQIVPTCKLSCSAGGFCFVQAFCISKIRTWERNVQFLNAWISFLQF